MSRRTDLMTLAEPTSGVVTRQMLIRAGMSRHVVRAHVQAGRLEPLGVHVLRVPGAAWCEQRSPIIAAVLEEGTDAWADGASALLLAGLRGWTISTIDVGIPAACTPSRGQQRGMRTIRHRLTPVPRLLAVPIPRAHPADAALRAASWAISDRQAATLLAMTAQQRLARVSDMQAALARFPRLRRRRLVAGVLRDIAGGAEALGELDFARECRKRGLPAPDRQVVRRTASGRYVLDATWESAALVVEIDGAHHFAGDNPTRDALRQNELALEGLTMVRIPTVALRVDPEPFFAQITRHLRAAGTIYAEKSVE